MALFSICRPCDRGNVYCGLPCRRTARRATSREARRRHRRSEEGRLDHRDHERARRARRRRVGDPGPGKLTSSTTLDEPDRARISMAESDVATGQVNDERHDHRSRSRRSPTGFGCWRRRRRTIFLQAILGPIRTAHPRAAATLLEGLALWHQRPLSVVLSADDADDGSALGLCDALGVRADAALRSRPRVPGSRRARPPPTS